jgi:hypothetical protein
MWTPTIKARDLVGVTISISILQGKSKLVEMSEGQEESEPEIRTGRAGRGVPPQ